MSSPQMIEISISFMAEYSIQKEFSIPCHNNRIQNFFNYFRWFSHHECLIIMDQKALIFPFFDLGDHSGAWSINYPYTNCIFWGINILWFSLPFIISKYYPIHNVIIHKNLFHYLNFKNKRFIWKTGKEWH